jgi:TonB family protein
MSHKTGSSFETAEKMIPIKQEAHPPIQAISISSDELAEELAFIDRQEKIHEQSYHEKISLLEQNLNKAEQQRIASEHQLDQLKKQTSSLEAESLALSHALHHDKKEQRHLQQKILEAQKEIIRLEKIQEISQQVFEEKIKTDTTIVNNYRKKIAYHLSAYWRIPFNANEKELKCSLEVSIIPNGDVVHVKVITSSGDQAFDQHAINAVYKSSPLPALDELPNKERPRKLTLTFIPEHITAYESFID